MKKYLVELTTEQRQELSHMISTGKAAARELTHARILLKADQPTNCATCTTFRHRHFRLSRLIETAEIEERKAEGYEKFEREIRRKSGADSDGFCLSDVLTRQGDKGFPHLPECEASI